MAGKIVDSIQEHIVPLIEQMGFDVLDIEYGKQVNGQNLTIVIDHANGIMFDDCVKVHRAINEPLDTLDPTEGVPYTLNVSSPGLDRPIKNAKDVARNKGKEVEVKLFAPINKHKSFVGLLQDMTAEEVIIQIGKETKSFDLKSVAIIVPVIKF